MRFKFRAVACFCCLFGWAWVCSFSDPFPRVDASLQPVLAFFVSRPSVLCPKGSPLFFLCSVFSLHRLTVGVRVQGQANTTALPASSQVQRVMRFVEPLFCGTSMRGWDGVRSLVQSS